MVNLNPDGKFIIETGQGITQSIKQSLDLSDEQCQILKENSVWDKVIDEIDREGSLTTVRNGESVQNPNKSNNFMVHAGDIIEFSKECWNKIVGFINSALKTNIQVINTKSVQTKNSSDNQVQTDSEKRQICTEGYNKILANLDKLELPANFDKANIEQKLSSVYQAHLKDFPETVELFDITRSMLCELLEETGLSLEERYDMAGKYANNIYMLADNGLKLNTVSNNTQLQEKVEAARDKLTSALKTLNADDLKRIGLTEEKRDAILGYLETLYYENGENSNTMQVLNFNDKRVIAVNEKLTGYDSMENMITMLMHEANHCYDTNFNTKQQERDCETLGCLTTALLIEKGVLTDTEYGRYPENLANGEQPHKFTDYLTNPDLLKNDIDTWVSGYTNYMDNVSGDITLEHNDKSASNGKHITIKAGDIVQIGNRRLEIGKDCYLDGMNSMPIFQVRCSNGEEGASNIVFNGLEPTDKEKEGCGKQTLHRTDNMQEVNVVRNGEIICTGFIYAD